MNTRRLSQVELKSDIASIHAMTPDHTYVTTSNTAARVDLTHNSNLNPLFLDMGLRWRDLELRVIYDAYHYKDPVGYGGVVIPPNDMSFDSVLASLKYDLRVTDWLKITPQFTFRHQLPWELYGVDGNYKVNATWHVLKTLDWNVSGFWLSQRLAESYPSQVIALDPEVVLNTFLNYHVGQFSVGVGVTNLLDVDRYARQPYRGGLGSRPLKGREVFAKIAYRF